MYTYQFVYVDTARKMTDVNPGSKLVYLRNTPAMQKKRIILHVSCAGRFVWEVDQYAGTCKHETATATQRWRVWMRVDV